MDFESKLLALQERLEHIQYEIDDLLRAETQIEELPSRLPDPVIDIKGTITDDEGNVVPFHIDTSQENTEEPE